MNNTGIVIRDSRKQAWKFRATGYTYKGKRLWVVWFSWN